MEQWKIRREREACCDAFSPDAFFAVLELPECIRRDFCPTCFHGYRTERIGADGEGQEPVFWKARIKPGKQEPTLDLASLRVLFDRLGETENETAAGLRYFVALLLLRKRVLRMVDPENDEQERADLVVRDPKVEGMTPVALFAPELDGDRLAGLKDELLAALADDPSEPVAEAG